MIDADTYGRFLAKIEFRRFPPGEQIPTNPEQPASCVEANHLKGPPFDARRGDMAADAYTRKPERGSTRFRGPGD
jgi:hypothetical protein